MCNIPPSPLDNIPPSLLRQPPPPLDNIPPSLLRQPPPPHPLTPAARKKGKVKPEMVGGNSRRTHTYYLRSCKRKRLTEIESIPDEVLFDFLVRLQAQDIYDSARLVCTKWYNMIHTHTFIHAHLQHSTYELLFQSEVNDSFFMTVGESGRVEISKNKYNFRCHLPTSCNGLLTGFAENNHYNLYLSNPATRQIFILPPFVENIINYRSFGSFGIGYAAASMEYKAAILFPGGLGKKTMCYILTIGVDNSWSTVGSECASVATTRAFHFTPLITEGFVHWYSRNEVLTLNVETEIITETSCPNPIGNLPNIFLSTGRYLSLLRPCGEFCWEVWEMKPKIDYQWKKVWDFSLEAYRCSTSQRFGFKQYETLVPIGWLKYLEILVFGTSPFWSQILVYNLLTHEIVAIELPAEYIEYNLVVHKNSLVWLGGC